VSKISGAIQWGFLFLLALEKTYLVKHTLFSEYGFLISYIERHFFLFTTSGVMASTVLITVLPA
jgi:hypothetical protein